MVIIVWNKRRLKERGITGTGFCEKCAAEKPFKLIEEQDWVILICIPITTSYINYWKVCVDCYTGDRMEKFDFDDELTRQRKRLSEN